MNLVFKYCIELCKYLVPSVIAEQLARSINLEVSTTQH